MLRTALLAGLVALLLAGCSGANHPLITAGSQKVMVDDFTRAARGNQVQYPGPPEAAKAELVQDLTRRALMLEFAHQLGQDTSQVLRNSDRENERRTLVQLLFAHLAPGVQPSSEAEARALYEARREEAQVSMIYTSSRESALGALARLNAGEPFTEVSKSLSLPGMLPPDGNMGPILPGALPDPLDGAVRHQKVGVVGGPYQTREGWFLIKITDRHRHEQVSWDMMRAGMFDLERQRKQRAAFNHAYEDLKAEWQMQLAPGGSQALFRVLSPVEPAKPRPEERRMPLATYDGGVYTLQDAIDDMQDANVQRPASQLLPAVEIWIETQTMMRVAVLEARRRHLQEEPDVVASLRRKREDLLLESVYQTAVATVPPPGPDLVRMAWEQLKGRFTKLGDVQVSSVLVADSASLLKLEAIGPHVHSLAEAAKAVDPSLVVTDTTVHYPNNDNAWSARAAMFMQMQPGAWYGPEPLADPSSGRVPRWRVIQLVNKTIIQQQFEELPPATQQNITSSAAELARDTRFREFSDSLARAYMPVVNRQQLAKLTWPVAAAGGAMLPGQ